MITVPKLVLIIVLIIVVWFAMRWLNRGASAIARRRQQSPQRRQDQRRDAIEDLVACRTCGAYVAAGARGCGKPACPQPR